jgi:DNA polymerase-3 subunit beta
MELSLEQSIFSLTCTTASRFTGNKTLTPLLAGLYLSAKDSKLEVRSSSGSLVFQSSIPAEVITEGEVVIHAQLTVSILKSLQSGKITLTLENDQLVVRQGKSRFEIATLSFESFPAIQDFSTGQNFLLPKAAFLSSVKQCLIATSLDETKPVLTSLLFELEQPNALIATDGFRLIRQQIDLSLNEKKSILIPGKALRELLPLVEKNESETLELKLSSSQNEALFAMGDDFLQVGLVVGDFPPYRNIIPEACAFSFIVGKDDLVQAMKQAMIFAKELSSIVVFWVEENELIVASQKSAQGKSNSSILLRSLEGQAVKFACNGKYVLDFLGSLEGDEVMIQGNESLKPVLFSSPQVENLLYLIMPFKLPEE